MDKELKEIINDLNITIADVETFASGQRFGLTTEQSKDINDSLKRAVGQMKAARSSIINAGIRIGQPFPLEITHGPR